MGAKSQRKGRAAELELARILQGYGYPVEAGRAQSYGAVRMAVPGPAGFFQVRRLASGVPSAEQVPVAGDNGTAVMDGAVPWLLSRRAE